ncbi:trafficking protein particle complex subunit 9-like [Gigantopelta aegis]|uniref:trafficking protein particle complex subunit 9-like n=1 Tax=Gigantopelta aegis TaxID=1735272 RepID=UPI001B88D76C|nr:trafficking protein particle complex subunit 9-like [Gigantopelta aegis]
MSLVDYSQTAEDHQTLLVLVRHTGSSLAPQSFNNAWDHIRRVSSVHVPGQKRDVYVRYKRGYPIENNEWGDFQAHRKVLGLISIGKCSSHEEFEKLFESYKGVKKEYSSTIYNSRLLVFGMNKDGSPLEEEPAQEKLDNGEEVKDGGEKHGDNRNDSKIVGSGLTDQMNENMKSVADKSKQGKAAASTTAEVVKSGQQHPTATKRSHSNSLTKESTGAEVVFYPDLEHAEDLEERLKEFVTSLFFVLEGKRLDRSFERTERLQLLCAPHEKKVYVGIDTDSKSVKKKCMGRLRKHLGDLCLQAGMPGEAILHYQTGLDVLRNLNDFLWMAGCYEGLSAASVILKYPRSQAATLKRNLSFNVVKGSAINIHTKSSTYVNGLDVPDRTGTGVLHPDDIIDKYEEAIKHYSKFKNAAMIEMEASFKACRVLIMQRKYLQASDFLQNVVYINLTSSEEDKINRYSTLASLYSQIGFQRKASFFKRVAAMQCVTHGTSTGWHQCYYLLLQALGGYNLSFDIKEFIKDHANGWPVLQFRVLHELVYSARRMGNPQLAVRHMTFLLHTMYQHLTEEERRETITTLEGLTARCEGTCHSLALENGMILPPVALTRLPSVKFFKVVAPAPHLQPVKINCDTTSKHEIFIYTPLFLGEEKSSDSPELDFQWVEGDTCEVQIQVLNPLKDELKIQYIGLLTDGVEMEQFPANPTLPPESGPIHVKLLGQPKAAGQLRILGYCTHVLGVRSNCKLKDLRQLGHTHFEVDVVPSLPQVTLESSLPKSVSFTSVGNSANVVSSASALLYAGQSLECMTTLHNISDITVEKLDVALTQKIDNDFCSRMFTWCKDNIKSQLPLQPANQLCFSLCIYGFSDFLSPDLLSPDFSSPCRSTKSTRSRSDSLDSKVIEALLTVKYSGGKGLQAGYCRHCSLALMVDVLPSLYITRWDVLPAKSVDHCYLVFDLVNVSSHEMIINYDTDKKIIIEPQQSRRLPVEIRRQELPVEEKPEVYQFVSYRFLCEPTNKCSQLLASLVDIRWSIPSTKVCGKVGIEYLKWTKEHLKQIQVATVNWEVRLNGQLYLPPDIPAFQIGDLVNLDVMFRRSRDVLDWTSSKLSVMITQDAPATSSVCDISDSVSCLGLLTSYYRQIPEDGFHHTCAFIFHVSGLFTIDCRFSLLDADHVVHTTFRCLPVAQVLVSN